MASLQIPKKPLPDPTWWGNVWSGIKSTWVGLGITWRNFRSTPVTVQYPDEKLPIDERYRGVHYLEQDLCIGCEACAKACPVDCIEMDFNRHGKELEWAKFTVDYEKCMFCELCVYPCPKDCIHLGEEYSMVSETKPDLLKELLSYTGLTEEQKVRIAEAEELKKKKAAERAAKKAAEAAAKAAEEAAAGDAPAEPTEEKE